MHVQNQLLKTLSERRPQVAELVKGSAAGNRRGIAREVCERFSFRDPRGMPQIGSCLKALRTLERGGDFTLPAHRRPPSRQRSVRRLEQPVPAAAALPERVDRVRGLELVLVESEEQSRIWNELMIREHPLGTRPLVGRQLRYLIGSAHGWLGAIGFSASALALHERDEWIGWDAAGRAAHLDKVVCLSRFLIRRGVRCDNLASRVLALACRSVGKHFEQRYGYRPWILETFVAGDELGTCFRAANWIYVGRTRGRGRQDRQCLAAVSPKAIFLFVLEPRFREYLGVPLPARQRALAAEEGVDSEGWAGLEFGGAPLGDKRLQKRLITIASSKAERPGSSFLEAVQGDQAAMMGYYRFIDAPRPQQDESEEEPDRPSIAFDSILAPHQERTLRRIKGQREVLVIHDTTDLNFATLENCPGLGIIGKNQTGTCTQGLKLHTSYAVTAAEGIPLGILHAQVFASQPKPKQQGKDARTIPIEDKETYRWITSWQACEERTRDLRGVRVVHVMDREADFFELFDAWRTRKSGNHLVVRAKTNRRTQRGDKKLFDQVGDSEVKVSVNVDIPRRSARPKRGTRPAKPAREKRQATLQIRYLGTELLPPSYGVSHSKQPVPVTIVHIYEDTAPADGSERIEWFLLTTLPVVTPEDAITVFRYYVKRWRIEEWHRVVKTCCNAEEPAHRDADRLKRVLAINLVIAWRIQLMILLGRELPDLPPQILFSDLELNVLARIAAQKGTPRPKTLQDYVIQAAMLGGYLNRKSDAPPGAEVLWKGLLHLADISYGFSLLQSLVSAEEI